MGPFLAQTRPANQLHFGALVQMLILRRNCKNFIFNEINFAGECGRFGEKITPAKNQLGQFQPENQYLNMRLKRGANLRFVSRRLQRFCNKFIHTPPLFATPTDDHLSKWYR
jgi:hypothetical protein